MTTGAWHYVVATYSGTSTVAGMNIYVDGVNQTISTLENNLTTSIVNAVTPAINGRAGPDQMSTDSMDEIRVSTKGVVFSPAYVIASFNNQSKPGTFFAAVTGLTTQQPTTQVKIAPYYATTCPGSNNLVLPNTTDTSVDILPVGAMGRTFMPFTTEVLEYAICLGDASALTEIDFSDNRYASLSGNTPLTFTPSYATKITGPFTSNSLNVFTLASPLSASKGDIPAAHLVYSTPHAANMVAVTYDRYQISATSNLAETCYYQTNAAKQTTYTVGSMTLVSDAGCPMPWAYAAPPFLGGIGDSILGTLGQFPDSIANTNAGGYPYPSVFGVMHNWAGSYPGAPVYYSSGGAGETMEQIAARITDLTDVKPTYGLIEGGINDILACASTGCTAPQIASAEAAVTTAMNALRLANIRCLVMLIGPWTYDPSYPTLGTNAMMTSADTINANTTAAAPTYGCTIVDWRCTVGQFRAGGPAGNCWDYNPAYALGALHPNQAGANLIGAQIYTLVPYTSESAGPSALENPH